MMYNFDLEDKRHLLRSWCYMSQFGTPSIGLNSMMTITEVLSETVELNH